MLNGRPMTEGFVEEQTRSCIEAIKETLTLAECTEDDVVIVNTETGEYTGRAEK